MPASCPSDHTVCCRPASEQRGVVDAVAALQGEEHAVVGCPGSYQPLQASERRRRHRHQPLLSALALDHDQVLAVALDEVADAQPQQLGGPQTAVGEDADDKFVPLRLGRVLEPVDLIAAQDLEHAARKSRRLRANLPIDLALAAGPAEEEVDGGEIAGDREARERPPRGALRGSAWDRRRGGAARAASELSGPSRTAG